MRHIQKREDLFTCFLARQTAPHLTSVLEKKDGLSEVLTRPVTFG